MAVRVDRGELQPFRNQVWQFGGSVATILHPVFQQKQGGDLVTAIGIVDEDSTRFHQMIVAFANQADDGFQQRMAWTDEGRDRLLIDAALFKTDALVFLLQRCARAYLAVTLADRQWDMRDFPTLVFPWLDLSAEVLECLDKEALDMMWLKTLRISTLHLQPKFLHARCRHCVVGQGPAFQKIQQMLLVYSTIDHLEQASLHFVLLSILDCLNQQVTEGRAFDELAQHIIDTTA
jgi:hypothetical protein